MYPPSSINWKNSNAVVQTPGVEPNQGRMYFPIIGWTWNSRNALTKTVVANRANSPDVECGDSSAIGLVVSFIRWYRRTSLPVLDPPQSGSVEEEIVVIQRARSNFVCPSRPTRVF